MGSKVKVMRRFSWVASIWALTVCSSFCRLDGRVVFANETTYRTVQVHVIHRHGDRSPITPMKDEEYWASQLVPAEHLEKVAQNTIVKRDGSGFKHIAGGQGVFGKLTELGLLQMVRVGQNLREELTQAKSLLYTPLFNEEQPLSIDNMKVISTDFPRTIQSVQGLLVGLLDLDEGNESCTDNETQKIEIDVRYTTMMIPDPIPRETKEQELLEAFLTNRPHVIEKEKEMLPLAIRVSEALHPLLGANAHEVNFGVVQEHPEEESIEIEPLAWNQLAEITKCLSVRDLLPEGISKSDVQTIAEHTAWRWFETLSNPRLIYLVMNEWVSRQVGLMQNRKNEPALHLWSCHDSSLIALLCAYRLQKPSSWPEYASTLVIELVEATNSIEGTTPLLGVRFSLNGERLRSAWHPESDAIPLDILAEKIKTEGAVPDPSTL